MSVYSLYLHIPFCVHRCGYCDFNTYAGLENLIPSYIQALCQEARSIQQQANQKLAVHTIFFGGGTPSLAPVPLLEKILVTLDECFAIQPGCEITLEANPGTVSADYLRDLYAAGFNRLSLGMQTANPGELKLLERQHDFFDVIHAAAWARKAGFDNFNLDLIFALPGQDLASWQRTLDLALQINPQHLSLYALTIEHGTPFGHWVQRGILAEPDGDLAAEMYETASETMEIEGYAQYEISNWARHAAATPLEPTENPDFACRHNLQYWRGLPYLGLGAGAHGYAAGFRTANVLAPQSYIRRLLNQTTSANDLAFPQTPATQVANFIETADEIGETMMMGLRLTREGVSEQDFQDRFQRPLYPIFRNQIDRLTDYGLLEWEKEKPAHLRLSKKGRLLGNQVFLEFL